MAWLTAGAAVALPSPPDTLRPGPADAPEQVALSWSAVSGATGYNVKRGASPVSAVTTIATVTGTSYSDTNAAPGARYYYVVTTLDASGESPATRGVMAGGSVIVDNGDPGTAFTGTWGGTTVAGYYGTTPVYAAPVAGPTPTATYTFTPDLPARGNYDVYLHWTEHPNRATNTPVDLEFPDGSRTVTVNQQVNGGVWNYIGTLAAESGTNASVVIRNNGASGNVIADAVQFVPRFFPVAPAADRPEEYTLAPVDEHFDGTGLDTSVWSTFLGRGNYSVADGRLHTKLSYIGSVPLESATTNELYNEANWTEGGIVARQAQKFGYHEARLRLPQPPARGVDTAYWHGASDELLNGYEIDAPEFFNKDSSGAANNYGYGVWDHIDGERTWDYSRNWSTLGDDSQYVTMGLEWRTDNSQVVYVNGVKVYTAPTSGMNDTESILPSSIILSTKVLDWLKPNTNLHNAEATWDYARYYQKPGWLGAVDAHWTNAANWGVEGIPGPGYAAVFNMPNAPTTVTVASNQSLQSLFLDSPSLPAHTFDGPGALQLGAGKPGDTSVTHGGILVNTTVPVDQTFNTSIVGLNHLQFANLSRTAGMKLKLNGPITGSGSPRDVDFVTPMAANANLGAIVLGQSLGSGLRHLNKAGDTLLTLPAGSQHTGELRIARGPVSIPAVSSLGVTSNSAVVFRPRYKHSESWRPRLTYTGPAATSSHPLVLGGWQADGVLESTGTGPLTWTGDLVIDPSAENPKQVLTRQPKLTLGGTSASGENVFAGDLSDAGVTITYLNADGTSNSGPATLQLYKAGSSTWVLTGSVSVSSDLYVTAGKVFIGSGTNGTLAAPGVNVSSGAEIGFGRDDSMTCSAPINGSGGLRKRGAGALTLTAPNGFTGAANVDAGTLVLDGSLAAGGALTVATNGILAGSGSIAKASTINGTLVVSPLTVAGTLTFGSPGRLAMQFHEQQQQRRRRPHGGLRDREQWSQGECEARHPGQHRQFPRSLLANGAHPRTAQRDQPERFVHAGQRQPRLVGPECDTVRRVLVAADRRGGEPGLDPRARGTSHSDADFTRGQSGQRGEPGPRAATAGRGQRRGRFRLDAGQWTGSGGL